MTKAAGYDMNGVAHRAANGGKPPTDTVDAHYKLVVVGAGEGGIAVAESPKSPEPDLAIIDPAEFHYYQPGWTMVGDGIFGAQETAKTMASLIPKGVKWIKAAVAAFEPRNNAVILDGCRVLKYDRLIFCTGLKLDCGKLEGLVDTLGRNGVTSNYRYDLAPCTLQRVREMGGGTALFTQPPMPIKCAGATHKTMYLSAGHRRRSGRLKDIDIHFCNADGVLFGVKDYVQTKKATFEVKKPEKEPRRVEIAFDLMRVCLPQTAAAARKLAPLWQNIVADIAGRSNTAQYDGYSPCPLAVARGKIVLSEFGYGGMVMSSFSSIVIDGTNPRRMVPERENAAADLLAGNAQRSRVDGETRAIEREISFDHRVVGSSHQGVCI